MKNSDKSELHSKIEVPKGREVLTLDQWKEKAESIFGKGSSFKTWQFQCPVCKESQSYNDFVEAKIENPDTKFYYSCIGRWVNGRGCDWTLGGLLQIHTTEIINEEGKPIPVFEFYA